MAEPLGENAETEDIRRTRVPAYTYYQSDDGTYKTSKRHANLPSKLYTTKSDHSYDGTSNKLIQRHSTSLIPSYIFNQSKDGTYKTSKRHASLPSTEISCLLCPDDNNETVDNRSQEMHEERLTLNSLVRTTQAKSHSAENRRKLLYSQDLSRQRSSSSSKRMESSLSDMVDSMGQDLSRQRSVFYSERMESSLSNLVDSMCLSDRRSFLREIQAPSFSYEYHRESCYGNIKNDLRMFYERSPAFHRYRFHGLSHTRKFTFALVPQLSVIRFATGFKETETSVQCLQDALSSSPYNGECRLHGHRYCSSCGFKFFTNVLLLAEDTSVPGNYFVYVWLRETVNKPNNNSLFMSQFCAVLLLEITKIDDKTDVKELISGRFRLEDIQKTGPKQLLIIFECKFKAPSLLCKTFEKIKDLGIPFCTCVMIANIGEADISLLHIKPGRTLLMSGIDFLHVSALDTQRIDGDDGAIISKSVEQILTRQKNTFWKKHVIEQIYFEDFPKGLPTLLIKLPNDIGIKAIKARSCGQRLHLLHHAESLDVDTSVSLRNVTETSFSSTLTTVTFTFAPHLYRHIFYKTFYEEFAIAICKIAQLRSIGLCDMIMGSEVLNIKLEEKEIELLKQSVMSNDDYRRYGTRIIGPKIEMIPFSKKDVDIELNDRNSFAAYVILDLICYELVKTNDEIVESYPARYDNDAEIVLVCFTKADTHLKSFKGLSLVKREDGVVSKESLHAENSFDREEHKCKKMMKKHFVDINETLSYHADILMKNHTNVEALKVSFVKSSKGRFTCPYPCIVFFCKVKGYIPNGESNIPQTLNHPFKDKKYKTDVREGFFTSSMYLTRSSDERNEELSLGCSIGEITSDIGGTLGPLVCVKETGEMCFLTVRHLFAPLPPIRPDEQLPGAKVVQPSDIHLPPSAGLHQNKQCGEVLVSQIGGQIDAALVKISPERQPSRVYFVNISREGLKFAGLSEKELPTFDDGAKMDAKDLNVKTMATRRIIKIGTTTGLTKGTLSTTDGYVRETMEYDTLETVYNGRRETTNIQSQLLVDSYVKKVFCQAGDSGSAVFLVDDYNRLHCIGMVIGLIVNDCTTVVTPIQNILDILGYKLGKTLELKKFTFD